MDILSNLLMHLFYLMLNANNQQIQVNTSNLVNKIIRLSCKELSSDSFLNPLLIMLIVFRELFRSHIFDCLFNVSNHILLAIDFLILLQFHVLSLNFREDVLDWVQLRSIGWEISNWPVQLLYLLFHHCSVMHPGVVKYQNLTRLEVVKVVL